MGAYRLEPPILDLGILLPVVLPVGVYTLRVYNLRVYSLGTPIWDLGVYTLRVYALGVYNLEPSILYLTIHLPSSHPLDSALWESTLWESAASGHRIWVCEYTYPSSYPWESTL